ncbi:MAG: hypothetical protein ACI4QX_02815, partial [Lachnospiraceae bacterium]
TYHTSSAPGKKHSAERVQTATRSTQTQNAGSGRSTETKGNTKKQGRGVKLIVVIVILYIIVMMVASIVPIIRNIVREFSEGVRSEMEGFNAGIWDDPEYDWDGETDMPEWTSVTKQVLSRIEPVEVYEEENYKCSYYAPEEVQKLELLCDEPHFDWTVSEFHQWLDENLEEEYGIDETIESDYNYLYEDGENFWAVFSSYRDYYVSDYFAVRADYDTSVEKLHNIGILSLSDRNYEDLYYALLKALDPETDWTKGQFVKALEAAVLSENLTLMYTSEALEIYADEEEGIVIVNFYPPYPEE